MSLREKLDALDGLYDEIESDIDKKKRAIKQRMTDLEDQEMFGTFESDLVKEFLQKPYVILPRGNKDQEWLMIIPKFFDFNVGWLLQSTDSYNVFIVNKYADYLGAVPKEFQNLFKFKPRMPLKVLDGVMLTGEDHQDAAWERYKRFLSARKGSDAIRIKKGKSFDLIAALIDDGILPFMRKPVAKEHRIKAEWNLDDMSIGVRQNLLKRTDMKFFKDAMSKFYKTGAVGVYWATGVGKTLIGLEVLSSVRVDNRPNVVISGTSAALQLQWQQRLSSVKLAAETIVVPFQSWHKIKNLDVGVMIIDECQHLPASTFSKVATMNCEYRMGLCLAKQTKIYTENGTKRIDELVEDIKTGNEIRVYSFNHDTKEVELKPVSGIHEKDTAELLRIKVQTVWGEKKLVCTPEHRFYVEGRGYIQAKDLQIDDQAIILQQPPWDDHRKAAKSAEVSEYYDAHDIWNKGLTKETDDRILRYSITASQSKAGKHYSPDTEFRKGHDMWANEEIKEKRITTIRESGCLSGENNGMFGKIGNLNPNWKGGVSYWRKEFYNSIPYKEFRRAVLLRDNYTCQKCGSKKRCLHVHHIESFSEHPDLRLDSSNGITLCFNCHMEEHGNGS